ncbi:MAG: hypothetical protein JO073_05090 [Actinobacteria bacterium]|nr:hypothetical protein [Actinomycetota bacterium]
MRLAGAILVAAVVAALAAGAAWADGDPASDYLLAEQVFLPYDAKIPAADASALSSVIRSANQQGFKIRVAVIWSDYDLGSVTALWKQPQRYAKFLGAELGFVYKQRLLVVMPNGFGFNWPGHSPAAAYALLAKLPTSSTPSGMAKAATAAVQRLAAADGVKANAAAKGGSGVSRNAHDRIVIIVAVAAALLLGAALRLAIRRRAARLR